MYREDLAYIHDQGYSADAGRAATMIVQALRARHLRHGRLLDLGCGSGHSTAVFIQAGYDVLGMDISRAMIHLAKGRVPEGRFRVGSFPAIRETAGMSLWP
jgi:2-polyprenyl-3-methyl-5-hydroxy-6-metoxy-1,4-benzoquinol methylase